MLSTLCQYKGVEIIEGAVCADHVYTCVSIPLKISVSNFMGCLKGKSPGRKKVRESLFSGSE